MRPSISTAPGRPLTDGRPTSAGRGGRLVLDLFAGTGSATFGFREAGWEVIEVDLEPSAGERPGRIVADVRRLPLAGERLRGRLDFLWASPPCTEFSDANARVDHRLKSPSLDLVHAVMDQVAALRPRYWIIENVRGAIPFLGIPAQKIGPFCLWGYFPQITATFVAQTYQKASAGRSVIARARIPVDLSRAVCQAIEHGLAFKSLLDLRPFRRLRHVAARPTGPASPELPL